MKRSFLLALLVTCSAAQAGLVCSFENPPFIGSGPGTLASGQDSWYLPAVAGAVDCFIYTYSGNTLGFSSNPNGGSQFLGGTSLGGSALARCQRDVAATAGDDMTYSFEMNGKYNGTPPTADNLGSFSTQPSTTSRAFIALMRWNDVNAATSYNAGYNIYDAAGVALATQVPGPAWQTCNVNSWYRQCVNVDYATNTVVAVGITDMSTNKSRCTRVANWYLLGGAVPTQPLPTAIRCFSGGAAQNVMGWDNVAVADSTNRVAGTVTFGGVDASAAPDCAVFEFRNQTTLQVIMAVPGLIGPGGVYDINAPGAGQYSLAIKHTHWLRQAISVDTTSGPGVANFSLVNGDIDEDNEVGISDYSQLSSSYGSFEGDPNWNPMADLNNDQEVGITDYAILSSNYGAFGDD